MLSQNCCWFLVTSYGGVSIVCCQCAFVPFCLFILIILYFLLSGTVISTWTLTHKMRLVLSADITSIKYELKLHFIHSVRSQLILFSVGFSCLCPCSSLSFRFDSVRFHLCAMLTLFAVFACFDDESHHLYCYCSYLINISIQNERDAMQIVKCDKTHIQTNRIN